jgi:glycerol-3-phosphate acyltransferase PlsY
MTDEEFYDYIFYIIDLVASIIALIFSVSEAYTGGKDAAMYNGPLIALSFFFKYVYLCYYAISKFIF